MNPYDDTLERANFGSFMLGLLQVILNPRQAWKDAAVDNYSRRSLLLTGFVPFLSIVALSSMIPVYYHGRMGLVEGIMRGAIDFSGYFVSVYICNYLLDWGLERWVEDRRTDQNRVSTFVLYTIGFMAFISLLVNAFPVELALFAFLPIYAVYILWTGTDYLDVPGDRYPQFLMCVVLLVFLPPYALFYCLSYFL